MSGTADPQVADQILRYISNARWFAGKGRRVTFRSLTPLPWLTEVSDFFRPAAAPGVRFEIAELAYPAEEDPEPPTAPHVQPEQDLEPTQASAASEPPEMDRRADVAPTEYYHLAISYRPAPHADGSRVLDPLPADDRGDRFVWSSEPWKRIGPPVREIPED